MIDIVHERCLKDGCNIQPSCGLPKDTKATYCATHKLDGMIDIVSKRCLKDGCNVRPNFGYTKDRKRLYCAKHKLDGMIDIKNKRCLEDGCILQPSYGYIKDRKCLYCVRHKLDGMINISKTPPPKNLCSQCSNQATIKFGLYYCVDHIPHDQLKVVKKLCKICDIDNSLTHICKECQANREKKKIRIEHKIVRHLNKKIVKAPTSLDRIIGDCSKRRPDVYYDCGTHAVIVEIDENQHRSYEDTCECARVNQIVNDLGGLPLTIIRYNPDNFKIDGKKKIVNDSDRLYQLVENIKKYIEVEPTSFVHLIQLFYDGPSIVQEEDITELVTL